MPHQAAAASPRASSPSTSPPHTPILTPAGSPPPRQPTPIQIWPTPFKTDSPNSPIDKPLKSVARIVRLISKKADKYTKLIRKRRGDVEDHKEWKAALKRAVEGGRLEEYMAMETQIKLSGLPRGAKKKLLKNNVKLCLREREWRSL